MGMEMPDYFNDEIIIPGMLEPWDSSGPDACDYAVVGRAELGILGTEANRPV